MSPRACNCEVLAYKAFHFYKVKFILLKRCSFAREIKAVDSRLKIQVPEVEIHFL